YYNNHNHPPAPPFLLERVKIVDEIVEDAVTSDLPVSEIVAIHYSKAAPEILPYLPKVMTVRKAISKKKKELGQYILSGLIVTKRSLKYSYIVHLKNCIPENIKNGIFPVKKTQQTKQSQPQSPQSKLMRRIAELQEKSFVEGNKNKSL